VALVAALSLTWYVTVWPTLAVVALADSMTIDEVLAANTVDGKSPNIAMDDAMANAGTIFFVILNPPLEITD
jgi:hypothetical protein